MIVSHSFLDAEYNPEYDVLSICSIKKLWETIVLVFTLEKNHFLIEV